MINSVASILETPIENIAPHLLNRPKPSLWGRLINYLKRNLRWLPFLQHPDYTPFLLVSHHWSGSAWVHETLNSHPRILSVGEELRSSFSSKKGVRQAKHFFRTPQSRLVQALGCKMFYEDAYTPGGLVFWHYWKKKNRRIIHLQRRNLLRIVVLEELALQQQQASTNPQAEAADTADASGVKAVEIIPLILMQRMAHLENLQEVFKKQLIKYPHVLELVYEDLLENPEQQFRDIQLFLGVAPKSLTTFITRQHPEPLSKLLLNYEEVRLHLMGNRWEVFLDH